MDLENYEWQTNRYIPENDKRSSAKLHDWIMPKDKLMDGVEGPPQATDDFSVEVLEFMGFVGIYTQKELAPRVDDVSPVTTGENNGDSL